MYQHITLNDHAPKHIVIISQKSILDMLPKKKKKPETSISNNIKGEKGNPSSAN